MFEFENIIIGGSNLIIGLIIILISIPLKNGKIKMNSWYGFRFQKSFESDEIWYETNKYGAERFIKWSIIIIIIGIFSLFISFNNNVLLILFFSSFPIIIFIPIIECYFYSKNL